MTASPKSGRHLLPEMDADTGTAVRAEGQTVVGT